MNFRVVSKLVRFFAKFIRWQVSELISRRSRKDDTGWILPD